MRKRYYLTLFIILYTTNPVSFATSLTLKSSAFTNNTLIPRQYTCEGADISPPLFWQHPPANTKSYALIVEDADTGNESWVHWVLFNIPPNVSLLPEATEIPVGAISSKNSWGQTGYRGPCPPGGTHHYFFKLYALDTSLTLNSLATKQDVFNAMQNHVLKTSELMGFYTKS